VLPGWRLKYRIKLTTGNHISCGNSIKYVAGSGVPSWLRLLVGVGGGFWWRRGHPPRHRRCSPPPLWLERYGPPQPLRPPARGAGRPRAALSPFPQYALPESPLCFRSLLASALDLRKLLVPRPRNQGFTSLNPGRRRSSWWLRCGYAEEEEEAALSCLGPSPTGDTIPQPRYTDWGSIGKSRCTDRPSIGINVCQQHLSVAVSGVGIIFAD